MVKQTIVGLIYLNHYKKHMSLKEIKWPILQSIIFFQSKFIPKIISKVYVNCSTKFTAQIYE